MSLLIKGLDMPNKKNGAVLIIYPDGTCAFEDGCKYEAVTVPTPHGRLKDADAVSLEGGPYEYDEWCKWALDRYMDAPTIIEAET